MSDKITQARDFFKSYLERNNTTVGEHSAVAAMVEYLDEYGGPVDVDIEGSSEYQTLKSQLEAKTTQHENDIKQRDHNWSELQKANTKIVELTATIEQLSKIDSPVSGSK